MLAFVRKVKPSKRLHPTRKAMHSHQPDLPPTSDPEPDRAKADATDRDLESSPSTNSSDISDSDIPQSETAPQDGTERAREEQSPCRSKNPIDKDAIEESFGKKSPE